MEIRIIEAAKQGQMPQAIVILEGVHVSSFDEDLPDLSIDKLLPLLPSLMKDYCADDVRNLHFSVVTQDDARKIILCCHHDVMKAAQTACRQQGLHLYAVWPDYMAVPIPTTGLNLYQDQQYSYIREANGQGITVPIGQEDIFLPDQESTVITPVTRAALCDFPAGQGLAVGVYSQQLPIFSYFKSFKLFTGLILCASLLGFILAWLHISQLKEQTNAYSQATVQVFQQAFPNVKRIVNVESQARALIRQQQAVKSDYFTTFSQKLFEIIKQSNTIQFESMNYEVTGTGPMLTILVKGNGFEQLETFKKSLAQHNMRVTDQGSELRLDGVFATLLIQQGEL